ncbi:hypothetical protein M501DRAFT_1000954 [Patellaria atrata CBS 101060]|uniref:Uncharacterized protein n=1 Tax=Patellaria atrata CBS 101060 TaxID=1346257 RepID=A0A9P4VVH7_9PEZI|nr:hypothetical protein M501DRAFT_1000954 [Patellaria atrata CBS 101060]
MGPRRGRGGHVHSRSEANVPQIDQVQNDASARKKRVEQNDYDFNTALPHAIPQIARGASGNQKRYNKQVGNDNQTNYLQQSVFDQEPQLDTTPMKKERKPSGRNQHRTGIEYAYQPQDQQSLPQTTPSKLAAYAGPTFHASPAPSALPIPKLFSKSVPSTSDNPSLQSRFEQETIDIKSNESELSVTPDSLNDAMGIRIPDRVPDTGGDRADTPSRAANDTSFDIAGYFESQRKARLENSNSFTTTVQNQNTAQTRPVPGPIHDESPLEFFFKRDREEKAGLHRTTSYNTPSSRSILPPAASAPHQTTNNPFSHDRYPSTTSAKEMFMLELDSNTPSHVPRHGSLPVNRTITSPARVPQVTQTPDVEREAKDRKLKDILLNLANSASGKPLSLSHSRTPDPYASPPFVKPDVPIHPQSGPSTPIPHGHSAHSGPLHYGNRNLSPMFQAAKGNSSSRRSPSRLSRKDSAEPQTPKGRGYQNQIGYPFPSSPSPVIYPPQAHPLTPSRFHQGYGAGELREGMEGYMRQGGKVKDTGKGDKSVEELEGELHRMLNIKRDE